MGLDMYLYAKKYFLDMDWRDKEEQETCKKIRKMIPEIYKSGNLNSIEVCFEAGYWRKANHIHKWFVENVQNGNDDCREYWVSKDDIEKLLKLCKEVLEKTKLVDGKVCTGYKGKGKFEKMEREGKIVENSKYVEDLLPTQEGFFFGGTDYDEFYYQDVEHTVEVIEKVLKLPKEWDIYYHSSW